MEINQGHSRLVGEGDAVTVYTAKGEVYREHDADAAMQRWLGFSLPMVALTHWIRGEQAPGYPVDGTSSDAAGDLASLTWGHFLTDNLLPVTLGNIVGGAVMVGVVYWFVYLWKPRAKDAPTAAGITPA